MRLNEEQLKAATHPIGEAALLLAGAGSGKTTVLTERIVWLIAQGVPAKRILALTFTNKAAGEIRKRVLERTGLPEQDAPRLTTIHSLALAMIRRNPEGFGLGSKITPIDDYGQNDILKKIVTREKLEEINPFNLKEHISYHRARGLGFAIDYTPEVHKRASIEYAGSHALTPDDVRVWRLFEAEKQIMSVIDFDDMLHLSNRRSRNDAAWRYKMQQVFSQILLDESQDTSVVAWEFINHLMGPDNRNLFVTGDISQSIYSFNGSSPTLIMDYAEDWRGKPPTLHRLVRNHRSVPEIVTLANDIQNQMTTNTLPLLMKSFRGLQGEKGKRGILRENNPYAIAEKVAGYIQNSGEPLKNFAILVRSSMQIREIEGELVRARIPYVVRGGQSLLQTEEVRDILAYIALATNPNDSTALARAMAAPKRGVGDVALEQLRTKARAFFGGDLVQACSATNTKLAGFANIIKAIQERVDDPNAALATAIKLSGYITHLRKKYAKDADKIERKIENLGRLREMVEGLSADTEMTTGDLVFQLTMDKGEKDDEKGVVTISTIHSAKGLEWGTCFIISVCETQLPHWRSVGDPSETDEERRIFYVAVTRARDRVFICVPERVQRGQHLSAVEQSRFLTELGVVPR